MFTLEQIRAAHSQVRSGADFPKYIQDMIVLGVKAYDHYVADGHTEYRGSGGFTLAAPPKWETRSIALQADPGQLKHSLGIHQQGGTDYSTFCEQAAALGVEKWTVDMEAMTCTYYDVQGSNMLEELIPRPV